MKRYEDRIVAYIDVLGFKNQIKSTLSKDGKEVEEQTQLIYEAYNSIRDIWDLDSKKNFSNKIRQSKRITIFSDCIIVSVKSTEQSALFYMLLEIMWLTMRLINKGILCRGAVVHGKLYHTQKMIFGPALVEAYMTESKAALYPRIILDESVIKIGAKCGLNDSSYEQEHIRALLAKDTDGLYYVEYFSKIQSELDNPLYDYPDYLQKLKKIIETGIPKTLPIDVRIKYLWMAEKYNDIVRQSKSPQFIKALNDEEEHELREFYQALTEIAIP